MFKNDKNVFRLSKYKIFLEYEQYFFFSTSHPPFIYLFF